MILRYALQMQNSMLLPLQVYAPHMEEEYNRLTYKQYHQTRPLSAGTAFILWRHAVYFIKVYGVPNCITVTARGKNSLQRRY